MTESKCNVLGIYQMLYLRRILQDLFQKIGGRAFGVGSNSAVMVIYSLEMLQTPVKESRVSAVGKYP